MLNTAPATDAKAIAAATAANVLSSQGAVPASAATTRPARAGSAMARSVATGAVATGAVEIGAVEIGAVEIGAIEIGAIEIFVRPRVSWEAGVRDAGATGRRGQRQIAADPSMTGFGHLSNPCALAGPSRAYVQCKNLGKQYPQTTRFAAMSGAKGPYPARDPV
jgi:hypothetical protein